MPDSDPIWYKDAIIYEVHVRAFQDADGYDIVDFTDIHPGYGTLVDFQTFLDEAYRRGLRVITELVLNHTSDQHLWFQRARRSPPGSPERDFYVWSDEPGKGETPGRCKEARVIFRDFEPSNWAWDPVAKAHYWHRFFSHQPNLNYDNPAVRAAILPIIDFWLGRGVDGLRLDAVPYHEFLKGLRRYADARFPGRMFLAEANQWPEDAARYFGARDACHMAFHFPLMPRLFMAVQMEDRFPVLDIMDQTPPIAESCQWALFLRNHDELTLEMVTDEERDYLTRAYAREEQVRVNLRIRRRLVLLMGNSRHKIELMNGLLFSLPGTPVVYYGDEIGMGDNIFLGDRNGVRTPMQWGPDRNAGFSRANPQGLYLPLIIDPEYHYETINAEAQEANPHSLLWWTMRLIALRKRSRAFGRGSLEFLRPANHKLLAFLRRHGDERILVVANLSRFVQHVELDLAENRDLVPVELFGRVEFPTIGERPYALTLGPHAFYWLALEERTSESLGSRERIRGCLGAALSRRITATRIRCHGDYHLGQLLWTGKDFVIIDVEGESFRHISERRHKRTPLRGVVSLLDSFHYATHAAWSGQTSGARGSAGSIRREDIPRLEPWTRFWDAWVGSAFLGAYLDAAAGASFLPRAREELAILLDVLRLQGMIDSLGYELAHRPDLVWIPLRGILRLLESGSRG